MFQIIGIVLLFGLVFGSFLMSGGKMDVILHAAPHELMAILGAGIAAFMMANSMTVIKSSLGGLGKSFAGPKWKNDCTRLARMCMWRPTIRFSITVMPEKMCVP